MRWRWVVATVVAAIVAGCSPQAANKSAAGPSGAATAPARAAGQALTFAMIPKQLDNPVFAYARQAAEKRAAELGVKLLWDGPATSDEAKQADVFNTFVAQKVDGIAVSCINADVMQRAIDKAAAAGIPVTTWDSDAPQSKRAAFYGINDYETGKLLGAELMALLPGGGDVALLSGAQGAQNLEQRLRGAKESLAKSPTIKVLEPVYCNDDVQKSAQIVSDVMSAHPKLAGWVMVGGWPLFVSDGLKAIQPGTTKVVSVDPLPAAQHWIADGHVQVCIGQKVFGWGAESVNLLYALATKQEIQGKTSAGFVDSGVDIVVKEKTGRFADAKYTALADYAKGFDQAVSAK